MAYAVTDGGNVVINIVEWDGKLTWQPKAGHRAVEIPAGMDVKIGWRYDGAAFVASAVVAPAAPASLAVPARRALDASDATMHRITEAVALGLNSWTALDVVAWITYRRALRAIIDGNDTVVMALPTKPGYPVGT